MDNKVILGSFEGECADANITNNNGLDITREVWEDTFVDIPGYEGLYQCNRIGQVKSLDRQIKRTDGTYQFVKGRLLKDWEGVGGYHIVTLCSNGTQKHCPVHRIVACTFIPNPDGLPQVNHIDCNKSNNVVSNLEWVAAEQNTYHAYQHNLNPIPKIEIMAINIDTGDKLFFPSINKFEKATNSRPGSGFGCLERGTICNRYRLQYADKDLQKQHLNKLKQVQPIGGNLPVPIICIETGQQFESMRKCAKYFQIDDELIRHSVRYGSGYVKKLGLTFVIMGGSKR